jgi:hypothetical protein
VFFAQKRHDFRDDHRRARLETSQKASESNWEFWHVPANTNDATEMYSCPFHDGLINHGIPGQAIGGQANDWDTFTGVNAPTDKNPFPITGGEVFSFGVWFAVGTNATLPRIAGLQNVPVQGLSDGSKAMVAPSSDWNDTLIYGWLLTTAATQLNPVQRTMKWSWDATGNTTLDQAQ